MTRHLAIGDIHGCFSALTALVDYVDLRSDDTLVTLGDYVDRGPDSAAVLGLIIELAKSHQLVALRGNHEIMMLDSRESKSWLNSWLQYGGEATLRSYARANGEPGSFGDIPDAHIDFLENELHAYYECETHFFVHANVDASAELERQSDATLYWRKLGEPQRHCSGKIMVCGHTPQKSGLPFNNSNAICIDTFAYGGGWLSCLDVESGTIWQANELGEKRKLAIENLGSAQ